MVNRCDGSAFHQKQQLLQTQVQESEIKEDKLAYQSPLPNPLKMHAFFLVFLEEQNLAQLI